MSADRDDPTQNVDIFHRLRVIMTDPTIIAKEWEMSSRDAERIRGKMAIVLAGLVTISKEMDRVVAGITDLADEKNHQQALAKARLALPPAELLATQLELDVKNAEAISELTAIIIASVMDVGEGMNQVLTDMQDVTWAQGDLAASAHRIRKDSEVFVDENRGVNTLLYNLHVWVTGHVPTIRYIFEIVGLAEVREAASQIEKSRRYALASAIYEGIEK